MQYLSFMNSFGSIRHLPLFTIKTNYQNKKPLPCHCNTHEHKKWFFYCVYPIILSTFLYPLLLFRESFRNLIKIPFHHSIITVAILPFLGYGICKYRGINWNVCISGNGFHRSGIDTALYK